MFYTLAKENLLAKFKARFVPKEDGGGYLFYPNEQERGFDCPMEGYELYLQEFRKTLKRLNRLFWLWLALIIPVLVWIQISQDYEMAKWEFMLFLAMPFPFMFAKGAKVYNAPNALKKNRPIAEKRNKGQSTDDRMNGISWALPVVLFSISLLGFYSVYAKDDRPINEFWLYVGLFTVTMGLSLYLIWRKGKAKRNTKNRTTQS